VHFGLIISVSLHVAILAWTLLAFQSQRQLHTPQTEPVAVGMITPSEATKVRQGTRSAKLLETEAKTSPKGEVAKTEAAKTKPVAAAPPPPPSAPPAAKAEEKKSDPVAEMLKSPPPAQPAAGEQKKLDAAQRQKLEADAQRQAEEQRKRAADQRKQEQRRLAELKRKEAEKKRREAALKKKREEEKQRLEAEAAAKSKFNPDKIAALLSKVPNKSAPPPSAEPDQPTKAKGPALGASEGRDKQLSASERAMIGQIIKSCVIPNWTVLSGGASAQATTVRIRLRFKEDGTFSAPPKVMDAQGGAYFQAISESALRAVHQCEPYNLPTDKYEFWKDVVMNFSPKDMF
jgi:colicin import membrane protein